MNTVRANWERFLIAAGIALYIFAFPHGIHGDGAVRYDALLRLLHEGRFSPMLYSYVGPIFSAALLPLGWLYKDGFWWVSRFNTFLFLLIAFVTARQFRIRWGEGAARSFLLLLFCATMFPRHVTDYYSEVFSACLAFLAILQFQEGRGLLSVIFLSLSVWNTPGSALGGGLMLLFFAIRSRRWRYAAAIGIMALGLFAENYLKFGNFLVPDAYLGMEGFHNYLPYSGGPGFSYPLFFGLLSVFFSFGKGLIFFMPGLFAFFWPGWSAQSEKDREVLWAGWIYLAGLLLVFSRWWSWYGGWFWGPRFFLFGSLLAVWGLAALLRSRRLGPGWNFFLLISLAISLWAGCQGVMWGQDFLEDCYVRDPKLEFICNYVPEYSVLWRVFVVWPPLQGRRMLFLVYFLMVSGTLLSGSAASLLGLLRDRARDWLRRYGAISGWRF